MESLSEIASQKRCAIYNELSHITPYYLTPDQTRPLDLETELRFHKRNLYFLALTFDHILICTDNLGAFTRFASADIVGHVICTDWFRRLLESGIIILCGWGSDHGVNLMENQIDYSMRYRPELKPPRLLSSLREIAANSRMIVRETAYGEKDHISFLRGKLNYLEGRYTFDEVSFVRDIVEQTQADHGFIGTMEIFPIIDDKFLPSPNKADAFYQAYFQSWQEYCNTFYSPAITVDSMRLRLPGRKATLKRFSGRDAVVADALYSPDFFGAFLTARFGEQAATKLADARPEKLLAIRNGDWKTFVSRYHECLEAASEVSWILSEALSLNLLSDEARVAEIVEYVFDVLDPKTDVAAIGSLLDAVLKAVIGVSVLGPVFTLFKSQINKSLVSRINRAKLRDFEPFLNKLDKLVLHGGERHLAIP